MTHIREANVKDKRLNANPCSKARELMLELFSRESKKAGVVRETQFVDTSRFPLQAQFTLKELYHLSCSGQENASMNIFALEGDQVCYRGTDCNGREEDKVFARRLLKKNEIYSVQTTFVNNTYSFVMLQEFPGEIFCTFFFDDICQ
jgi:hypothetical protein